MFLDLNVKDPWTRTTGQGGGLNMGGVGKAGENNRGTLGTTAMEQQKCLKNCQIFKICHKYHYTLLPPT